MSSTHSQPTLETLPDEILLEVCRYLSCADILQSFFGLNHRMTCLIAQYRQHVSLYKANFIQTSYLCTNVLPYIGSHIRSLVLDCYYAVLQERLFAKHFENKMSILFPRLEKITLHSFHGDALLAFLNTLHGLDHLVEIRLNSLFQVNEADREPVLQKLFQANNNQLTSILIDNESHCLAFNNTDRYLNILNLQINLTKMTELPSLFAAVPNVRSLDVFIKQNDRESLGFDQLVFPFPLRYVTDFRLQCTLRYWWSEELVLLYGQLPNVQHLSIFISTEDKRLATGNTVLPLLPATVQQFHYSIFYNSSIQSDPDNIISASWPDSHPIKCATGKSFWLIHTLPWNLANMIVLTSYGKTLSSLTNHGIGYGKQVEHLEINIARNFTLKESLGIIAQCNRVRKISIFTYGNDDDDDDNDDAVQKKELAPSVCLPKLFRLGQILFNHKASRELDDLSSILLVAPNLWRLRIPFDRLMKLLENERMCHLLSQRITALSINKNSNLFETAIGEDHVSKLTSIFTRLRDLDVGLTHLPISTVTTSNEHATAESIAPSSIESMILRLLVEFKEHKLTALCITGHCHERLETDAKLWLEDHSILCGEPFDAFYYKSFQRLFIWM